MAFCNKAFITQETFALSSNGMTKQLPLLHCKNKRMLNICSYDMRENITLIKETAHVYLTFCSE
jgi:hypothetical protein